MTSFLRWLSGLTLFLAGCGETPPAVPARMVLASYAYGPDGALQSRRDALGNETRFRWESGRPVQITYPDGSGARFAYNALGQRLWMEDGTGRTTYEYDPFHRLVKVAFPGGRSISYEWDLWGRPLAVRLSDGFWTRYEWDLRGRLGAVEDSATGRTIYEYGGGRRVGRLPNGVSSTFTFSDDGLLSGIDHRAPDGTLLIAYRYTYDPNGRRVAAEERTAGGSRATRYGYDGLGRLQTVSLPGGETLTYRYNAVGDRVAFESPQGELRYDVRNGLLVAAGETAYEWDARGNLLRSTTDDRETAYRYDFENRLMEVAQGERRVLYRYDGDGVRVERAEGQQVTRYLQHVAGGLPQVVAEYDGHGTARAHYVLGLSRLARVGSRDTVFYLEDGLGSTVALTDGRGQVVARYRYSPFGTPHELPQGVDNPFLFTGEEWDPATGLLYLRARSYDPELGRFLTRDPVPGSMQRPQTLHAYAYANNDPINLVDPAGTQAGGPWPPPPPPYFDPRRWPPYQPIGQLAALSDQSSFVSTVPDIFTRWSSPLSQGLQSFFSPEPDSSGLQWLGQRGSVNLPVPLDPIPVNPLFHLWQRPVGTLSGEVEAYLGASGQKGAAEGFVRTHQGQFQLGTRLDKPGARIGLPDAGLEAGLRTELFNGVLTQSVYVKGQYGFVGFDGLSVGVSGKFGGASFEPTGFGVPSSLQLTPFGSVMAHSTRGFLYVAAQGVQRVRELSGPASAIVRSDPLIAGPLDRALQRLLPLLPPPGGTGGAAAWPGGVRLAQTAKFEGLGSLVGVVSDQKQGLVLLFEQAGREGLALPMRWDDFREALRSVFAQQQTEWAVSIDPDPQDPDGPRMLVALFGGVRPTSHAAHVLFQSDWIMKKYSLGADPETRQPFSSAIGGYGSLLDLDRQASARRRRDLWNRFWIVVPEGGIVLRRSPDGRCLTVDRATLEVRTETMAWRSGKLVPAGKGIQDQTAESFARWFTEQLDNGSLAREQAVYDELRSLAVVYGVVKAMRQSGIPIDPRWTADWTAGDEEAFETPAQVPAITVERSETRSEGNRRMLLTQSIYGGVSMDFRPELVEGDRQAGQLQEAALEAIRQDEDAALWTVRHLGRELRALALPGPESRELGSFRTMETDLAVPLGGGAVLAFERYYSSFRGGPSPFGPGWSLNLPRLAFRNPLEGRREMISVAGHEGTEVVLQHFTLTDDLGFLQEQFTESFVDQDLVRIGFRPQRAEGIRGLYPHAEEAYSVVFDDGREWVFDAAGRLGLQLEGRTKLLYAWQSERLVAIRAYTGDERPSEAAPPRAEIRLEYDDAGRIVTAAGASEARVTYTYDDRGRLVAVQSPGGPALSYRYGDDGALLTAIAVDGREALQNGYDSLGRLLSQRLGPDGPRVELTRRAAGTGVVLSARSGGGAVEEHYDERFNLVRRSDGRHSASYSYDPEGRLQSVELVDENRARTVWELSSDRRQIRQIDPAGGSVELRFGASGELAQILAGGQPLAGYRYAEDGRPLEADYGRIQERFAYDQARRMTRYVIAAEPGSADSRPAEEVYDYVYEGGRLVEIRGPDGGKVGLLYEADKLIGWSDALGTVRLQHDGQGRLAQVSGPGDRSVRLAYEADGLPAEIRLRRGTSTAAYRYAAGRLVEEQDFTGDKTEYGYSESGLLIRVRDPAGSNTRYEYLPGDRLQRIELPDGSRREYGYDEAGRLEQVILLWE